MPIFSHYAPLADISTQLSLPSLVFSIISPIIVLCRFVARSIHGGELGADDWTILASLVFTQTVNVQMIICCSWGFGKHTKLLDRPLVDKTLHLYWFAQILYKIGIGLTKVSILAFYLRVFGINRKFRIACFVVMGLVVAWTIASVMTSIFQCSPVQFAYNKKAHNGHGTCIDLGKFWYANAGYNIGTDLIIIAMPIFVIRTLQLPKRTKIALCGIFALGLFVCVTSILRFTTLNISTAHTDIMWQSIASSMWTVIESNLGIIVACMPALRRPIAAFFPKLLGKMGRTTAQPSKKDPDLNGHSTQRSTGFPLDRPTKKFSYREPPVVPVQRSWLDSHKSEDRTMVDAHDMEEAGDTSEGYQGSDDHILMDKQDNGRWHHGHHITKTTEISVDPVSRHGGRNDEYYPG